MGDRPIGARVLTMVDRRNRLALLVVSACGMIGLALCVLVMMLIEQQIARWSIPTVERERSVADLPATSALSRPAPSAACNSPAEWITADDYPLEAIRNDHEGTVRVSWTVGDDGRVRSCEVVESSGHDLLDRAGCQAIISRGCYDPAKLTSQRTHTRRIVWRLPRG